MEDEHQQCDVGIYWRWWCCGFVSAFREQRLQSGFHDGHGLKSRYRRGFIKLADKKIDFKIAI